MAEVMHTLRRQATSARLQMSVIVAFGATSQVKAGKSTFSFLEPIPQSSPIVKVLDTITGISLIYVALMTPYEVTFLPAADAATVSVWFLINRVIDLIFWSDLILQFRIIPGRDSVHLGKGKRRMQRRIKTVESGATDLMKKQAAAVSNSVREQGMRSLDTLTGGGSINRMIAKHYLEGNFTVDFLTCCVSILDFVPFWMEDAGSNASSMTRHFKLLRLLRLLRLTRLLRLVRGSRALQHLHLRFGIQYAWQVVIECITSYILLSHWLGCLFYLQTVFADSRTTTWLYSSTLLGFEPSCLCREILATTLLASATQCLVAISPFPHPLCARNPNVHRIRLLRACI